MPKSVAVSDEQKPSRLCTNSADSPPVDYSGVSRRSLATCAKTMERIRQTKLGRTEPGKNGHNSYFVAQQFFDGVRAEGSCTVACGGPPAPTWAIEVCGGVCVSQPGTSETVAV